MISLDADTIREAIPAAARNNVAQLKTFGEIDSTNSYLMQVPGPEPGKIHAFTGKILRVPDRFDTPNHFWPEPAHRCPGIAHCDY